VIIMIYRVLDSNGDYSFGKGSQDFLADAAAVAQAIKTNILLLQGEWWENIGEGLPLFQSILGQSGTTEHLKAVDAIIRDRISSTKGVSSIQNFSSTYENRRYSFSCTVTTTVGQTATVEVTL